MHCASRARRQTYSFRELYGFYLLQIPSISLASPAPPQLTRRRVEGWEVR
jgi:hypothetical protein